MSNPIKTPTTLAELNRWYRHYFPYCMIGTITEADLTDEHLFLHIGFRDMDDPWDYRANHMLAEYIDFMADYNKAKRMFSCLNDGWYAY